MVGGGPKDEAGWERAGAAVVVGWAAVVAAEAAAGRVLLDPPGAGAVAAELALALGVGGVHALGVRARPRSMLALPELPALLAAVMWTLAGAFGEQAPIPGGGAPASGGWPSALAAAWSTLALGVVASRLRMPAGWARGAAVRAALAAPLAAVVALAVTGRTDPSWHPSDVSLGPIGAAVGLAALAGAGIAGASSVRAWLGLVASGVVAGVATWPPSVDDGPAGPLILLVTVDTLRTDAASEMASVRRLAARGERFDDALAASSWTIPSVASALTGRWPDAHGAGRPGRGWPGIAGLDGRVQTLQERFRAAGWRTGASVANAFLVPLLGFDRGWDAYLHADALPRAPLLWTWLAGRSAGGARHDQHRDDGLAVVDRALAWWDHGRSEPTLLWVHLLDPHTPYFHAVLGQDHPLYPVVGATPGEDLDATAIRRGEVRDGPRERAAVAALYRAEVGHADRALGRLLDGLEARGALEGATVLLTSDHGEELWEHGGFEHGHALWPEVTAVPLVLVHPEGRAGTVRRDPASGVDVAATLLAAAGIGADGLDGVDLRGPVAGDRLRRIQGTFYFRQQQAVVRGRHALVEADGAAPALYDRVADPGWTVDRAGEASDVVEALARELAPGWADQAEAGALELDVEALRALGYLQ
jgi:arylsulfatase A-like enzyme